MKKLRYPLIAGVLAVMAMLLADPAEGIRSVKAGLALFSSSVLPSLFLFLFLTKLLTMLGGHTAVGSLFAKPCRLLFGSPKEGGYVLLLSLLSGYPIGAKLIDDLYAARAISARGAKNLASYCSTSGVYFVCGVVGAAMLRDVRAGYVIFLAHVLAALLCGILLNLRRRPEKEERSAPPVPVGKTLADCVYDSASAMLLIGGFITVFYVLADMISASGALFPAEQILWRLFRPFGMTEELARGFCYGIIEMTRGAGEIAAADAGIGIKVVLISVLVSFGGISINLQATAFLSRAKVSACRYFACKTLHALLTAPISLLLCAIFF